MYVEIAKFLEPYKDRLDDLYQWEFIQEIPRERFEIFVNGGSWLEKTRDLKTQLIARIQSAETDDELIEYAEYFIKDWGGIKRFSRSREIVGQFKVIAGTEALPNEFNLPYKSISSWSKWVSLICPQWACIYDARVAYSLNAINYLSGGAHKIFPTPEGRNTKLKMLDVSTLLVASKIQPNENKNPKALRKQHFIKESDAYRQYLNIIRSSSNELWGEEGDIHNIEMLLFSIADSFAYEALFEDLANRKH